MEAWLAYILKVNACLIGFYTFYWLFLRHSTFLQAGRVYLLVGLVFSFVIPLVKIPMPAAAPLPVWDFEVLQPVFLYAVEGVPDGVVPAETTRTPFPVWSVAAGIWFAGVFILLLRLIVSLVRICRLKRRAEMACVEGQIVRTTDGTDAFSFFRAIFLPRSGNLQLVLEHEKVHVRQGHSCDLLFMETAALLLWFNPAVWLYRRALKLLHEYLADEGVVRRQGGPRAYLECVLAHVRSGIPGLPVHAFGKNDHSLKKRIAMMTKNKTPRRFAWVYLLALPLAGALILGFSARAEVPAAEGAAPEQVVAEQTPADDPIPSISPLDKEKIKTTRFNLQLASRDSTGRERPYFDRTLLSDFNFRNFPSEVEVKECFWSFNTLPGNVYATAVGTVAETGRDTDEGYFILIRHGEGYTTRYGRLEKIRVEAGDAVQRGQVIGEMQNDLSYRVHNNNASDATIVYAHASLSFQSPEPDVARDSAVVIKFRSGESFSFVFPIKEKDGERVAVSGFGQRRGIPHTGIDIAVSQGTEVVAAAPGRVAESKYDDGRGNYIVIRHNDEYSTLYAHLEKASVKAGDTVEKGQVIGTVGSTGLSTGPHLHYEIHKNGTPGDWGN